VGGDTFPGQCVCVITCCYCSNVKPRRPAGQVNLFSRARINSIVRITRYVKAVASVQVGGGGVCVCVCVAGNQALMVAGGLCHVRVKPPRCCPLVDRMLTARLVFRCRSSCGEDMEASDGEGEEEALPPSKVKTWRSRDGMMEMHIFMDRNVIYFSSLLHVVQITYVIDWCSLFQFDFLSESLLNVLFFKCITCTIHLFTLLFVLGSQTNFPVKRIYNYY